MRSLELLIEKLSIDWSTNNFDYKNGFLLNFKKLIQDLFFDLSLGKWSK